MVGCGENAGREESGGAKSMNFRVNSPSLLGEKRFIERNNKLFEKGTNYQNCMTNIQKMLDYNASAESCNSSLSISKIQETLQNY